MACWTIEAARAAAGQRLHFNAVNRRWTGWCLGRQLHGGCCGYVSSGGRVIVLDLLLTRSVYTKSGLRAEEEFLQSLDC